MHGLVAARRDVPRSLLVAVVERVRGRVLDLALEYESLDPQLGTTPDLPISTSPEKLSAVYQTVVHAHQAFIGTNTTEIQSVNVTPGDADSLRRYLEGLGVGHAETNELVEQAAACDQNQAAPSRLKATIARVAGGVTKLAPEVAMALIEAAISKWLGE